MSKRTDAIRTLFAVPPADVLSADNKVPPPPRVTSGSVRSLKETFSDVERENEELRARLESHAAVVEIAPDLIDPSPIADRLDAPSDASYEALKASIAERGQEIPILLRPHPKLAGRYQSAYGHRRVRAARELGLCVKALVRPLSDEDVVVAQGVENSARQDLSFIERAAFAFRLEEAGFQRATVQQALAIDRAEVSKLIAVARAIPDDVVRSIGRAEKVGRGRWQALAELLQPVGALKRARKAIETAPFAAAASDARFILVLDSVRTPPVAKASDEGRGRRLIRTAEGKVLAGIIDSKRELRLVIDRAADGGFSDYLLERLPSLFAEFVAGEPKNHRDA